MTRQSRRTVLAAGAATAVAAFVPKTIYAQSPRKVTFTQAWLPDGSNLFIYAGKQ